MNADKNNQDRDLKLLDSELKIAIDELKDIKRVQYTNPLLLATLPTLGLNQMIKAGLELPPAFATTVMAITALAGVVQYGIYQIQKSFQKTKVGIIKQTEELVLNDYELSPTFRTEIDGQAKQAVSPLSKITPSSIFNTAVAASIVSYVMTSIIDTDRANAVNVEESAVIRPKNP